MNRMNRRGIIIQFTHPESEHSRNRESWRRFVESLVTLNLEKCTSRLYPHNKSAREMHPAVAKWKFELILAIIISAVVTLVFDRAHSWANNKSCLCKLSENAAIVG